MTSYSLMTRIASVIFSCTKKTSQMVSLYPSLPVATQRWKFLFNRLSLQDTPRNVARCFPKQKCLWFLESFTMIYQWLGSEKWVLSTPSIKSLHTKYRLFFIFTLIHLNAFFFVFLAIHRFLNLLAFCCFWVPQVLFRNWAAAFFTDDLLLFRDRNLFTVVLLDPEPYKQLWMKCLAASCLESLRSSSLSLTAK